MEKGQPMCYITYAVPANLMPTLSFEGGFPLPDAKPEEKEPSSVYPPGFMPEWFLRGSFPEDDFEN